MPKEGNRLGGGCMPYGGRIHHNNKKGYAPPSKSPLARLENHVTVRNLDGVTLGKISSSVPGGSGTTTTVPTVNSHNSHVSSFGGMIPASSRMLAGFSRSEIARTSSQMNWRFLFDKGDRERLDAEKRMKPSMVGVKDDENFDKSFEGVKRRKIDDPSFKGVDDGSFKGKPLRTLVRTLVPFDRRCEDMRIESTITPLEQLFTTHNFVHQCEPGIGWSRHPEDENCWWHTEAAVLFNWVNKSFKIYEPVIVPVGLQNPNRPDFARAKTNPEGVDGDPFRLVGENYRHVIKAASHTTNHSILSGPPSSSTPAALTATSSALSVASSGSMTLSGTSMKKIDSTNKVTIASSKSVIIQDLSFVADAMKTGSLLHLDSPLSLFAVFHGRGADFCSKKFHTKLLPLLASYRGSWSAKRFEDCLWEVYAKLEKEGKKDTSDISTMGTWCHISAVVLSGIRLYGLQVGKQGKVWVNGVAIGGKIEYTSTVDTTRSLLPSPTTFSTSFDSAASTLVVGITSADTTTSADTSSSRTPIDLSKSISFSLEKKRSKYFFDPIMAEVVSDKCCRNSELPREDIENELLPELLKVSRGFRPRFATFELAEIGNSVLESTSFKINLCASVSYLPEEEATGKIRCRHILLKHKDVRNPYYQKDTASGPTPITRTKEEAENILKECMKRLLDSSYKPDDVIVDDEQQVVEQQIELQATTSGTSQVIKGASKEVSNNIDGSSNVDGSTTSTSAGEKESSPKDSTFDHVNSLFPKLVRKFSECPSSKKGPPGDLGFFGKGKMMKEFDAVVFALKENEISDIITTESGLHIVQRIV